MKPINAIALRFLGVLAVVTAGTLPTFATPALSSPCADFRHSEDSDRRIRSDRSIRSDTGYVQNCGHRYPKMRVSTPTGTPLNVRDYPNGPVNRQIVNGSVILLDTRTPSSDSDWVNVAELVCPHYRDCDVVSRGVVYAPYLVPAKP